MVIYQFQQAGNEEFQSMKKWDSAVGIVAAGANGTVAAGERSVNFAMHCENFAGIAKISQPYRKFRNPSEIFAM